MWADFPIFGDYNKRQAINFDAEDLINLFLIEDPNGKKKFAYLGTPGLKQEIVIQEGAIPVRALFVFNEYLYGVFGSKVFKITSSFTPTFIGSIGTNTGYVSITANNGNQIIFVDGQAGYIYNANTGVFAQITDPGFPPQPLNVVFLDGYFVIPSNNTHTYQISALNDGTKWNALDTASIEAYPGFNVGVGIVNRRLYFFKDGSTEVWYNNGNADFPFRRDNNLLFNYGCLTPSSIVSGFGFLFWLAQDADGVGSVMMTTGQEPVRISDDSIEDLLATFVNAADVAVYIYKDNGHIFLVMSFNTDDRTLVYDIGMRVWHKMEMESNVAPTATPIEMKSRHLSNCHAYFNNQHYVGSYKASILYSMSRNYFTNAGEPIRRVRTPKHFFDPTYKMMQIKALQVDMQVGLGDVTGDYVNPQLYMNISRDGGKTFGNTHKATLGRLGQTRARAMFRNLGTARDFLPKFSIYAPVGPIVMLGASINYEVLRK